MIRFSAEVLGVEVLNRGFNRVDQFISDFRNIWPFVTPEIYAINLEQLESQGARGASGKYAPLSPAYAKAKAIQFPGKPILQATGALFESLTSPDAFDSIYRPERDQLTVGTKVPYARAHQTGTGRMPARPPISMNEQSKRRIQKAIQRGLVDFTRRAGFQVEEKAA